MFVQHQKATAHWCCSLWPNMEGKNAAFSRNQTGKKGKKERFSCMQRAQWDRALTLTTQWPQSWLALKTAWLMVMLDQPWHITHTHTHTPAWRRSHEREAPPSFHCADFSFFQHTQKAFLGFMLELRAVNRSPLERGTFLLVKKRPSRTPQSSAQVRNGLFFCPHHSVERLWHSPATATLSICLCRLRETYQIEFDAFLEHARTSSDRGKLLGYGERSQGRIEQ